MEYSGTPYETLKHNSIQQPIFSCIQSPLRYRNFAQIKSSTFPPENEIAFSGEDAEISIFDARKYFSESNDEKQHLSPSDDLFSASRSSLDHNSVDGRGRIRRVRSILQTSSSDASSNSQMGLLANPVRKCSNDEIKKKGSPSRRWSFGRKYFCIGKNSEMADLNSETTLNRIDVDKTKSNLQRENTDFALSNQQIDSSKLKEIVTAESIRQPVPNNLSMRDSLGVFRPMHEQSRTSHFNHVRSVGSTNVYEIGGFSAQAAPNPICHGWDTFNVRRFDDPTGLYNNRINSDEEPQSPSVAATECYPPSEVSIDWSIVTAEGGDKASLTNFSISASEIGSVTPLRQRIQESEATGWSGSGGSSGDCGERWRKKGSGLFRMSCRNEKSVSVGPSAVKWGSPSGAEHVSGRPSGSSQSACLSMRI